MGLASPASFHVYLVALFALAALGLWRVVRSPFGHVLRGLHENEARMEAVGYAVRRYKLLAFVTAGTLGGTVLGTAAFILLQSLVSSSTERRMLILGLTFIAFVLFAPGGIAGAFRGRLGLRA